MYKYKNLSTFYTPTGQVINNAGKNKFLYTQPTTLSSTSFAPLKKIKSLKLQQ